MNKWSILLLAAFASNALNVNAQGCSDAGFCSIGAMESGKETKDNTKAKFGLNLGFGAGESSDLPLSPATAVSLFTVQLTGDFSISEKSKLGIRLPIQSSSDENGRGYTGLADPIVSFTSRIKKEKDVQWWYSVAAKIPTNDGNVDALPMIYQSSLGTYDLILGTSLQYKKWKFALGYQHPLINNNKNERFVQVVITPWGQLNSTAFIRKPDALIRAERTFSIKKAKISAGLLAIYHLGEDEASYETPYPNLSLEGSEGLTLNINLKGKHSINQKFDFTWLLGSPAVVREFRPDGLTRGIVLSAGLSYKILKVDRSLKTIGTPAF